LTTAYHVTLTFLNAKLAMLLKLVTNAIKELISQLTKSNALEISKIAIIKSHMLQILMGIVGALLARMDFIRSEFKVALDV